MSLTERPGRSESVVPASPAGTAGELRLLLAAAAEGRARIDAAVRKLTARRAAEIAVREILFRADDGAPQADGPEGDEVGEGDAAAVQLTLTCPGEREQRFTIGRAGGWLRVLDAPDAPARVPAASLSRSLSAVIAALYGQPGTMETGLHGAFQWTCLWRDLNAFQPGHAPSARDLALVQRILSATDGAAPPPLSELAVRYRSDKWGPHFYTRHYERHFAPFQTRRLTVLEIGVGGYRVPGLGGESLRMWKRFFPRAMVYGVDLEDKRHVDEDRIVTRVVDQSEPASLAEFAREAGQFDLVIDDGSHMNRHVITTLRTLLPHVRDGGIYVIEDLQTAYWDAYGGSGTELSSPDTSTGYLKTLIDGLNHEEFLSRSGRISNEADSMITGMHFYHNMAFIDKGVNSETSAIARALDSRIADAERGNGTGGP